MSTQVQYRRGTNAQNDAFVGALAEITVDTTNKTLRVHDGVTAGGAALAGTTATQTLTNKTYQGTSLSVTGNVTGSFIFGNGSQLTGIDATSIQSGTSNVRVVSSGGNVAAGIGGTSNVLVISSTGTFVTGVMSATGNITGNFILGNGSQLTGIDATSIQSGTSNVRVQSSGGNVAIAVGGAGILRFTSAGIVNDMGNGVGNIGNATGLFNTVFAKATSAQYADVAEKYVADRPYPPGTVLEIGGAAEVQETTAYASTRIAGVVSTKPALLMNSTEADPNSVEIALLGRVPCRVTGTIHRGDLLTSSDRPGVATALRPADYRPGCVIGKALEAHATASDGLIEVLVGRL